MPMTAPHSIVGVTVMGGALHVEPSSLVVNLTRKNEKKMKIKLWIDDERNEPDGWLRVSDAANAIIILDRYHLSISHVSFDYDIGTQGNGATVARYLAAIGSKVWYAYEYPMKFNIHSANQPGVQEILSILQNFSKDITLLPAKEMWKLHDQKEKPSGEATR